MKPVAVPTIGPPTMALMNVDRWDRSRARDMLKVPRGIEGISGARKIDRPDKTFPRAPITAMKTRRFEPEIFVVVVDGFDVSLDIGNSPFVLVKNIGFLFKSSYLTTSSDSVL